MRNNIFGYFFILFAVIIMGFAIYKVNIQNKPEESNNTNSSIIAGDVVKGTEMTLAIADFDNINPIISSNKKIQDIDKIIFEPLIGVTEDFKLDYILAKECVKTTGNTYIIKLRQNVKWSDGNRFTSDDVKFTIDKLKENSDSVYSPNINSIQEVDIIDNYTLKIILSGEVKNFEYYLNFPILSNNYYAETNFWNTEKNKAPTTTGKYKISEVTNNTIVLEKNELWWNKEQNLTLEKITINLYSTVAEMYNAFKMGNIDLITTENSNYQNYIGTIGYNATEIEGRELLFLALNTNSRFLSDVNVRKAIRASINKNDVISNSYGWSFKIESFLLNTNNYLINKQEDNYYNFDEKWNFLTNSGWNQKNGVWQKYENYKTIKLELNLVVRGSNGTRCRAAENIKNQLQDQGIIINIIYADDNLYNSYLNNVNYDLLLCSIEQPIAPDLNIYFGYKNLANYNNQEASEIMNFASNSTDENELKNKFQRLYDLYNEDVPYLCIGRNKIMALSNTDLVGEIKANWYNMFYNIGEWYTQ